MLHIRRRSPNGVSRTVVEANEEVNRRGSQYHLRAIVEYKGTGSSGHFVAHVRHPDTKLPDGTSIWHTCDDDTVIPCTSDTAKAAAKGSTMLWYERADTEQHLGNIRTVRPVGTHGPMRGRAPSSSVSTRVNQPEPTSTDTSHPAPSHDGPPAKRRRKVRGCLWRTKISRRNWPGSCKS